MLKKNPELLAALAYLPAPCLAPARTARSAPKLHPKKRCEATPLSRERKVTLGIPESTEGTQRGSGLTPDRCGNPGKWPRKIGDPGIPQARVRHGMGEPGIWTAVRGFPSRLRR